MLVLVLGAALAADDSFYVRGEPVRYADLLAAGTVKGRTGRLLVGADPAALVGVAGVGRVTPLHGGVLRVEPLEPGADLALARALHGRAGVRWATPDLVLPLTLTANPDDPFLAEEWHLENTGQGGRTPDVDIDAELAWTFATGAGQLIAVVDSGVQTDHPDLSVIPGHDYIGVDDDPNPDDSSSGPHGTGAAGIAAATGDNGYGVAGVAWGADVYAIRLIGGSTTLDDVYNAFIESVDAGATVISNSWGYGTDCGTVPAYDTFDDMFDYAEDVGRGGLGTAVVFAAGNGACDIVNDGMLHNRSIVVVAAIEGDDNRAWYSSYGDSVDIAAPTGLLTTDMEGGGYGSYEDDDAFADGFSGTSGATPVVSGVMALMFEANPRLTAKDARAVLCDTAVRIDHDDAGYDDDGRSPYYGCGRVDAGAAVATVANTEPAAPTPRLVADTAEAPRVVMAWEPAADPDDDVLRYVVRWSVNGGEAEEDEIFGTTYSLDLDAGDTLSWSVAAVDPWGEGAESEPVTLSVVAKQKAEAAATCGGVGGSAALGWIAAVLLAGRRRPRGSARDTSRR